MNITAIILKEITEEIAKTKRILSRLNDEHLDWKPHAKSMSIKALAAHIVELHNWVGIGLKMEKFDLHSDIVRKPVTTVAELIDQLERNEEANIQAISAFSEADWNSNWVLSAAGHVLMDQPRIDAFRVVIQSHLIHHRGQLSVYLRLLDIPVPGLYGPSADDLQQAK